MNDTSLSFVSQSNLSKLNEVSHLYSDKSMTTNKNSHMASSIDTYNRGSVLEDYDKSNYLNTSGVRGELEPRELEVYGNLSGSSNQTPTYEQNLTPKIYSQRRIKKSGRKSL